MITVVSGTDRPDSYTLRVAKFCTSYLADREMLYSLLTLDDITPDFFSRVRYGHVNEQLTSIIEEKIIAADRFVMVVPEYNGSYPGVLKHLMDVLPPDIWKNKRCALIGLSSGRAGNLRGLDHLMAVCHYLQMEVYSQKPVLSGIHQQFDSNSGMLINAEYREVVTQVLDGFLRF